MYQIGQKVIVDFGEHCEPRYVTGTVVKLPKTAHGGGTSREPLYAVAYRNAAKYHWERESALTAADVQAR